MSTVMKASEFVSKLRDIATNYKTLYIKGCFGSPMTKANKTRYCNNHSYNKKPARTNMIQNASTDTFGFDCVCLIKGVLWGWNGNKNKTYGGATYKANGVPDINADSMIKVCSDLSTDFTNIEVGEAVWTTGHIGVYIGDGLAIECTPSWKNNVQITACNCTKAGYKTRNWKKHGKLPYIDYDVKNVVPKPITPNVNTSDSANEKIIWDFLYSKFKNDYAVAGLMGNLYAESVLKPNNVQNSYERKLGFTDEVYTAAVDGGKYNNFVRDSAGYGLAQWTYWSRKQNLLKYAQSKGVSIGDLTMQLEFLYKELSGSYKGVMSLLKSAKSVREASDVVLTKFERPADQSEKVKVKRSEYGQKYYDKYAKKTTSSSTTKPSGINAKVDSAQGKDKTLAGTYKVTASSLHIRAGAGATKKSLGTLKRDTKVKNFGYYTLASNNVKWLYVQTDNGIVGFCSSRYLKKC